MDLKAFLHPAVVSEKKEIVISKRFLDDEGKPIPFKIRSLTQEENENLAKQSTHKVKANGRTVEKLDATEFTRRIVVAGTVEPDFSSKEMCDNCGVLDPLCVPAKMLLAGEFSRLAQEIMELSGFETDIFEEAKN